MISPRSFALRYTLGEPVSYLRGTQRRWAQVHDVRFLATHRQADQVFEKYKAKLDQKVKESGLKDVNDLKAIYKDKIRGQRENPTVSKSLPLSPQAPPSPPSPNHDESSSFPTRPSQYSKPLTPPGLKTLSSYIDISKILELPSKEIEHIWRLRHASDPQSLCAVIPRSTYARLDETARRHPQFILPLPREGQGAEIHFLQWTYPTPTTTTVLFTHLAEFKLRGEFSQPHTTVTHHLDLAGPKGLILLHGSVIDGRGITVNEGKWLLMCLQKFYGGGEDKVERQRLLEQFSQGDENFKLEKLLEEAEKII